MLARTRERKRPDGPEAGGPLTEGWVRVPEQGDGMLDVAHRRERSDPSARRGIELQHHRGDDAERSLAADEKLLEIVPCIVLAETTQSVPHATISQNDFDAQCEIPRIAESQNRGAACVGRQIAADRAASFSGKRERKEEPGVGSGLLNCNERGA